MKTKYLLTQLLITDKRFVGNNYTQDICTLIRVVVANSKEEAIGKFILETKDIKAIERLNPSCDILKDVIVLK